MSLSAVSLSSTRDYRLIAVKLFHTIIWAVLAGCVIAIPVLACIQEFRWALVLSLIIVAECGVLAANRGRCPLTDVAARYTAERADNFDIYLPNSVARHNKTIFGTLFLLGEVVLGLRWLFAR